jgi:hypothetical protein
MLPIGTERNAHAILVADAQADESSAGVGRLDADQVSGEMLVVVLTAHRKIASRRCATTGLERCGFIARRRRRYAQRGDIAVGHRQDCSNMGVGSREDRSAMISACLPSPGFASRLGSGSGLSSGAAMSEGMPRRKALSLLGLRAALGFTLSSALEPWEAEAQETAAPAAPAEATGTRGMNRRQSRRTGRHERRHGRHERRHERRTGDKQAATPPAGTAPAPQ